MVGKKNTFTCGTAQLQKELQGFAAFVAYQDVVNRGDSITKESQQDWMGDAYFGDPTDSDSIGFAEQVVKGIGIFGGLYTAVDCSVEVCGDADDDGSISSIGGGSTSTGSTGTSTVYTLKPYLHCLGAHTRIVRGSPFGINKELMHRKGLNGDTIKSREPVAYRTLYKRAMEMLKNCKKALSVVMAPNSPYKNYIGTGNLPSGMAFEDYLMFVRKGMFKMLVEDVAVVVPIDSNTTTTPSDTHALSPASSYNAPPSSVNAMTTSEGSVLDDDSVTHVPPSAFILGSWYFSGYFVFALLGPIVPPNMTSYRAELLMTSCEPLVGNGPNGKKTIAGAGRAAARRKSSATTAGLVKVESDGSALAAQHHAQIASIAQVRLMNEGRMTSKTNDRIIEKHTRKVASVQTLISETKDLLRILDSTDERRAALVEKVFALNEELHRCIEKREDVEDSIINKELNLIVESTSVTAFIDATIASAITPDAGAYATTPQSTNKRRRMCDRASSGSNDGHLKDDSNYEM